MEIHRFRPKLGSRGTRSRVWDWRHDVTRRRYQTDSGLLGPQWTYKVTQWGDTSRLFSVPTQHSRWVILVDPDEETTTPFRMTSRLTQVFQHELYREEVGTLLVTTRLGDGNYPHPKQLGSPHDPSFCNYSWKARMVMRPRGVDSESETDSDTVCLLKTRRCGGNNGPSCITLGQR